MKRFTLIIAVLAALATIVIGFDTTTDLSSPGTLGFIGWSVLPYVYLAIMNRKASTNRSITIVFILALLTAVFGVWAFVDASYIHGDAQSAMAWPIIPLCQLIFLAVASIPVYFLNKSLDT